MLTEERHNEILTRIKDRGAVTVTELTKLLDTSESTIRRDLVYLAKIGKLNKVHGGATLKKQQFISLEDDFTTKSEQHMDEKMLIAKYAASQINDDDFVYLDAGTTTSLIIDFLDKSKATFITNGITHAKKLVTKGFKAFILGGELKSTTEAVVGLVAATHLHNYNFTKAFLGANGVAEKQGYSTPDTDEAFVKAAAIERSFVTYVLVDSSKFGKVSSVSFGQLDRACIITDKITDDIYNKYTVVKEVTRI